MDEGVRDEFGLGSVLYPSYRHFQNTRASGVERERWHYEDAMNAKNEEVEGDSHARE